MRIATSKLAKIGSNPRKKMDLTGYKYHHPRHKKILDGYDYFSTYVIVVSLKATTNLVRLDVQRRMMTSEASRLVSRISHSNKDTTLLSILFVPYLCES